ncbi:hypothetical protein ACFWWB_17130 [Streptomyces sp. NPDC058690]|uniref:hypothetical protein n=1 Tax=Streptomyces sp. NPDC058690 TaxID=3346600 RepID=UPI003659FA6B
MIFSERLLTGDLQRCDFGGGPGPDRRDQRALPTANIQAQIAAQIVLSIVCVTVCVVRDRSERQLHRVWSVAEAARSVLL